MIKMKKIALGNPLVSCALAVVALWLLSPAVLYSANNADNSYIRIKTQAASLTVIGGEVQVTYETGETKTYGEGDEIPPLPDGAIVEVLSGDAKLQADNTTIELNEGDVALLFVDKTYQTTSIQVPSDYTGQLGVLSGGARQTLSAGDTYWAPTTPTPTPPTKKTADATKLDGDTDIPIPSSEDEDAKYEDRIPNPSDSDTEPPPPPERDPETDSGQ
jgi:hypothetical protein